jgi:alpha-glucosidase (family GH31 glycosyl hydrolase)
MEMTEWRARYVGAFCALALAVWAGAYTAPAEAEVTIGPQTISLQVPGAGATLQRAPFQISFSGAGGEPLLSEVPNTGALALPRSVIDPAPEPDGSTLYAPLAFLVGSDQPQAYTTGIFDERETGEYSGDLESVEESGTEYSAREVTAAEPYGEGVRMTLSTNDPSGRTLEVTLPPEQTSAGPTIRLAALPSEPAQVAAMSDSFASTPTEAFHGFGGRHNALDQHGQEFFNWVDQENEQFEPEQPADTNLYPDGPQGAYYVQSTFVSNQGYGFDLETAALSRWSLDAAHPESWQVQDAAPQLEYVFAPGDLKQAAAKVSSLTGRQPVPPSWALGPMLDREVEEPTESAANYQASVEADLARFESHNFKVSAYRIEGWGFLPGEFLSEAIQRLRALSIKPLLYFRPFVGQEQIGTEKPGEYATAVENGYVATDGEGQPYIFRDNFGANAAVIDLTKPAAVAWWRERIDAALDLGAEGFMLDFGEQVLPNMHFANGMDGAEMHNAYPVLVDRVTREIVEQYEAAHPGRQIVFYTRSGYSGDPGSAAYTNFNFPGDEATNWNAASGLPAQTVDMLNRGLTGAFGFGTDIGGYLDFYDRTINGREVIKLEPTTRELLLRWAEWAALTPIFRLHGAIVTEHTPWSFPRTESIYKSIQQLHQSAEPLIEELWKQADETGEPITRPLYLEYPDDPQAAEQTQEWMLGPDVLVAPVVEKSVKGRSVYFPEGCWSDPANGQTEEGPVSADVRATLSQLPFFFRCGTTPFRPSGHFGRFLARRRTNRSGTRSARRRPRANSRVP